MAFIILLLAVLVFAPAASSQDNNPKLIQLSDYLDQATRQSPTLEVGRHQVQALKHQADAAGRLPDLKLSWGEMIVPVETKVGPQQRAISVSQTIPWFGTLGLRRDGVLYQAAVEQMRLDATTIQLHQKIRSTWYGLARVQLEQDIYLQYRDLVSQSLHSTQAAYESGQSSFSQLVSVQREMAQVEVDLQNLQDRFHPLTTRLNQLAGLSPDYPMPAADLEPPGLPHWAIDDLSAWSDSLEIHNPTLQIQREKLQAARTELKLAGMRSRPDLTVGLDYIMTGEGDDPTAVDAGQDPVIARLALSLPIWGGRPGAPAAAKDRQLLAEQAGYQQQRLDLVAEVESIRYRIRSARRNLDLYSQSLVPQAQQELASVSAAYQSGHAEFSALLKTQKTLLDLQLAQVQARADHALALNDMAALLGQKWEMHP